MKLRVACALAGLLTAVGIVGTAAAQGPPAGTVTVVCSDGSGGTLEITVAANARDGISHAIDAVNEHHPAASCAFD